MKEEKHIETIEKVVTMYHSDDDKFNSQVNLRDVSPSEEMKKRFTDDFSKTIILVEGVYYSKEDLEKIIPLQVRAREDL